VINRSKKPVLVALMGSTLVEAASQIFQRAEIPTYPFPERAASALAALARRAEYLAAIPFVDGGDPGTESTQAYAPMPFSSPAGVATSIIKPEDLIAAYGIQSAPIEIAHTADEAAAGARRLGLPVALKICSPDILHKSDLGGVILDLATIEQVKSAYTKIIENVKAAQPKAHIDGVSIQRQIPTG
jgi:acetyltransferase